MTGRVEIESKYPPIPIKDALPSGARVRFRSRLPSRHDHHYFRHRENVVTIVEHSVGAGNTVFNYHIVNEIGSCEKPVCRMWVAPWELEPNCI